MRQDCGGRSGPSVEMEVLKSGLTLLSNPIGTLICGDSISQTGFGEFAGPDFSVSAKKVVHPLDMRRG